MIFEFFINLIIQFLEFENSIQLHFELIDSLLKFYKRVLYILRIFFRRFIFLIYPIKEYLVIFFKFSYF